MKKLLLTLLLCIISTSVYAQLTNIHTSGLIKVSYDEVVATYDESYSISYDLNKQIFVITSNSSSSNFGYTGTYKILYSDTVQDSQLGRGRFFSIERGGTKYVVTITQIAASFSKSDNTRALCWHFGI